MKLKNWIIAAGLVGSLSLVAAGCGSSAPESTAKQEATKQQSTEAKTSEGEDAKSTKIEEAEEAVKAAEKTAAATDKDLNIKEKALKKATEELTKLQEGNIAKNDTENDSLEGLQTEEKRLTSLLTSHREKLTSDVEAIEEEVTTASEGITNSEEEFQKLPTFGDVHTTSEVLIYVFGFKWLWGAFVGYAPTFFTYNPEYSENLRGKLVEQQERLLSVQKLLRSAVTPQNSQGIFSDIAVAREKITEAMEFFDTNTVARNSYTVSNTVKAFEKQKRVVETIAEFVPVNQKLLEETQSGIRSISMSREERKKEIQKVQRNIKHLNGQIKALEAQLRADKQRIQAAKATLESLTKQAK